MQVRRLTLGCVVSRWQTLMRTKSPSLERRAVEGARVCDGKGAERCVASKHV